MQVSQAIGGESRPRLVKRPEIVVARTKLIEPGLFHHEVQMKVLDKAAFLALPEGVFFSAKMAKGTSWQR